MSKKSKTTLAVIISLLIVAAAIIAYLKLVPKKAGTKESVSTDNAVQTTADEQKEHPYIDEVNYQGPIEYMELYDYPFSKSEIHIMNKDLVTGTKECSEYAKKFVEDLFTNDYRELLSDPGKIKNTIEEYSDPDGIFFLDVITEAQDAETVDAYAESLSDMYVRDSLSTEAEFVTNASMVYQDAYLFCRGVIKLRSHGDIENAGKVRCIPAEVLIKQDPDGFTAVGIVPVEGYAEFEESANAE